MSSRRPSFLILGAAKCGTTSLRHQLGRHPDVFVTEPMPREPVFFESQFERGLEFYLERYYAGWQGEKAAGESRPANLLLPFVPPRIRALLPDARFLVILRNPVERAWSHWWQRYSLGVESQRFEPALQRNLAQIHSGLRFEGEKGARLWKERLSPMGGIPSLRLYLDLGDYAAQLRQYFDLFDRERFRIFLTEDLQRSPARVLEEAWAHIGVDPRAGSPDAERQNVAVTRLAGRLRRAFRRHRVLRRTPAPMKRAGLALAGRLGSPPAMSAETREWLTAHYREPNRELEDLLDRDLGHWQSPPAGPGPRVSRRP